MTDRLCRNGLHPVADGGRCLPCRKEHDRRYNERRREQRGLEPRERPAPPIVSHLDEEDVRNIRKACARKTPTGVLAAHYGLHKTSITRIARRTTWAWVE